jgi:hypothetical protein
MFSTHQRSRLLSLSWIFLLLSITPVFAQHSVYDQAANSKWPLIGAIRFDAWSNSRCRLLQDPVTKQSNCRQLYGDYLGPAMWHYRLPFFAKVISKDRVQVFEDNQNVIDQEIQYSAAGGLSFWAFNFDDPWWQGTATENRVSPNPPCNFNYGLKLYLSSPYRNQLHFALTLFSKQSKPGDAINYWETVTVPKVVSYVKQPTYQKVLGHRPLIFLFGTNLFVPDFGSVADTARAIAYLRQEIINAGYSNPYIVGMDFSPKDPIVNAIGLDAISAYSAPDFGPATFEQGRPYSDLAAANVRFREKAQAAGYKVVPVVNTGWDRRPHWTDAEEAHKIWYYPATPDEIANNVQSAVDWVKNNPQTDDSRTILIYAWNEFSEGGWLAPTLQGGSSRLDAIRQVRE